MHRCVDRHHQLIDWLNAEKVRERVQEGECDQHTQVYLKLVLGLVHEFGDFILLSEAFVILFLVPDQHALSNESEKGKDDCEWASDKEL